MNTHFIQSILPLTSASHNQITNAILVIKVHVREVDSSRSLGSGSMKGNPLKESMVCHPIRGSRVSRYPIKGQSADFIVLGVTPAVTLWLCMLAYRPGDTVGETAPGLQDAPRATSPRVSTLGSW